MKTDINFSGSIGSNVVNVDAKVRNEIDWEQRKFELTKVVTTAMLSNPNTRTVDYKTIDSIFKVVDSVLEEYIKQSK